MSSALTCPKVNPKKERGFLPVMPKEEGGSCPPSSFGGVDSFLKLLLELLLLLPSFLSCMFVKP